MGMNSKIKTIILTIIFFVAHGFAAVDTVMVYSTKMAKEIPVLVATPTKQQKNLPHIYLLHGYGGSFRDWNRHLDLQKVSDAWNMVFISPDGSPNSWYLDSPIVEQSQYESFIINDVIPAMNKRFKMAEAKVNRAITGFSMGGHGALYLAIRHPHLFVAAAGISGVVDLPKTSVHKELAKKLGPIKQFAKRWQNNSIVNMLKPLKKSGLPILIDCGDKDYFIEDNRRLHQLLLNEKIAHSYVERPGKHNWSYCKEALPYHLLFFKKYLKGAH